MKHKNSILKLMTLTLCLVGSWSYGRNNSSENAEIKVFKEQNDQWTEIKQARNNTVDHPVLRLEYDTYYTIQISEVADLNALKNLAATLGTTVNKEYQLPLNQANESKKTGMEDYFTELPFALVSYSLKKVDNKNVYIVLMKTKSKEMIRG